MPEDMTRWWLLLQQAGMYLTVFVGIVLGFLLRVGFHLVRKDRPTEYRRLFLRGLLFATLAVLAIIWVLLKAEQYDCPWHIVFRWPYFFLCMGMGLYFCFFSHWKEVYPECL